MSLWLLREHKTPPRLLRLRVGVEVRNSISATVPRPCCCCVDDSAPPDSETVRRAILRDPRRFGDVRKV